ASVALERALRVCEARSLPMLFVAVAPPLGYAYALSGHVADGLSLLERAVAQVTAMRSISFQAMALVWLSETYLLANRRDKATELAARAIAFTREHRERSHEAWTLHLLGEI